jgi:putative colanic acid biosynthesis acetyltransferase WcaF
MESSGRSSSSTPAGKMPAIRDGETPSPRPDPAAEIRLSRGNVIARGLWEVVSFLLFRPTPRVFHFWRRGLLRLFGAKIGPKARIAPSCRVWAPWNLRMAKGSSLGPGVDCFSVAPITLEEGAAVSQYCYLCAASRDIRRRSKPLIAAPITIGKDAWVCADAFIGMGVRVGEGAVVGARASVFRDVPPWTVVAGNPARPIAKREYQSEG